MGDKPNQMWDLMKEMFKDELNEIREFQKEQDTKNTDFSKALEDLSGKITEQATEADRLKESLEPLRKEMEDFSGKIEAQLNEGLAGFKERCDKFEDDPDGAMGLKQLYEKITGMDTEARKWEDVERLVKENKTKIDEFERNEKEFARRVEELKEKLDTVPKRVDNLEGIVSTVSIAQEALEDSVSRKYEKLWTDLLHAIEEMKGEQMEELKSEILQNQTSAQREAASLVGHAMTFMASAHTERRKMAFARSLVIAWKDQMMISARRRMGISLLHKMTLRRERTGFDSWHRAHKIGTLCDRLNSQYTTQLKDVYDEIKEGDSKLHTRCDRLDSEVANLDSDKASTKSLEYAVQQLQMKIREELKAIHEIQVTQRDHGSTMHKHDEQHRAHAKTEDALNQSLSVVGQDLADVMERMKALAHKEDVKSMISDILMIWNSIKQLDTSKADKKDVDCFALETGNRDKLSIRRLEDLEADLASKSRQETLRLQEKWNELEGRVDESGRQFRHWEQMWEKLSGFVEDLVAKVGDLQATAPSKEVSLSQKRTGGGWQKQGSSHRSVSRHETTQKHPPVPGATPKSANAKNLWLSSAKGIVDATLDQALTIRCSCGNIFMDDSNFCRQCGKPRAEAIQAGAGATQPRSRPTSAPGARVTSASRPML